MARMMSLPVSYQGREYYILVRFVTADERTTLRVRVMNSDLERTLCGQDAFILVNGKLLNDADDEGCAELRMAIRKVLEECVCDAA